jgi:hypothetical protein
MYSIDKELGRSSNTSWYNADSGLNTQLKAQEDAVKNAKSEWESALAEANSYRTGTVEGGYCAQYKIDAKKRTCQNEVNAKLATLVATDDSKKN